MGEAQRDWEEPKQALREAREGSVVEVDDTPLGGEHPDVPVDLDAERIARQARRVASLKAKEDTAAVIQGVREKIEDSEVEPVTRRPQWMERYPNTVENPAGNTLSKRQLQKGRSFWAKLGEWFARR